MSQATSRSRSGSAQDGTVDRSNMKSEDESGAPDSPCQATEPPPCDSTLPKAKLLADDSWIRSAQLSNETEPGDFQHANAELDSVAPEPAPAPAETETAELVEPAADAVDVVEPVAPVEPAESVEPAAHAEAMEDLASAPDLGLVQQRSEPSQTQSQSVSGNSSRSIQSDSSPGLGIRATVAGAARSLSGVDSPRSRSALMPGLPQADGSSMRSKSESRIVPEPRADRLEDRVAALEQQNAQLLAQQARLEARILRLEERTPRARAASSGPRMSGPWRGAGSLELYSQRERRSGGGGAWRPPRPCVQGRPGRPGRPGRGRARAAWREDYFRASQPFVK